MAMVYLLENVHIITSIRSCQMKNEKISVVLISIYGMDSQFTEPSSHGT